MIANEIRDRLASYVSNEISIHEFDDWVAQHTWNVHRSGDSEAEQLAFEIEAKLAEFSGGQIDEPSLRHELAALLPDRTPKTVLIVK